jgi:hypothetical protein
MKVSLHHCVIGGSSHYLHKAFSTKYWQPFWAADLERPSARGMLPTDRGAQRLIRRCPSLYRPRCTFSILSE